MLDHHVHLSLRKDRFYNPIEKYLKNIEGTPVNSAIVFGDPRFIEDYNKLNEYVLKVSKNYNVRPFFILGPHNKEKLIEDIGKFDGVKVHIKFINATFNSDSKRFDFPSIPKYDINYLFDKKLLNVLVENQKPILFHTDEKKYFCDVNDIVKLKEIEKDLIIILAHCGRLCPSIIKNIKKYDPIYIDISPLNTFVKLVNEGKEFVYKNPNTKIDVNGIIKYLIKNVGYKRIIWGTDSPWCDVLGDGILSEIDIRKKYNFNELW
jgi:predicted TIM-barrel fold metal-dependent hydrolase